MTARLHSLLYTTGDDFTSGFPTLAEIRGNASLLSVETFLTHDGERRHYNHMGFTCHGHITKLTFIALPTTGDDDIVFEIRSVHSQRSYTTTAAARKFGVFGYQLSSYIHFHAGDTFHMNMNYQLPSVRLLHRIGNRPRTVCWSWMKSDRMTCDQTKDYPLLAVATGSIIVWSITAYIHGVIIM